MKIKTLGRTGLRVTPIGVGLAALGRPGYITLKHGDDLRHQTSVDAMRMNAHNVLEAAWLAGIRYFDAARSYGRAEDFLASWLIRRGISPQEVTVGSKWGYTYTAGWKVDAEVHEVKDLSLDVLRRQYGESRGFLGDHLDLYQVHSATLESGLFENVPLLEELTRYKSEGLAIGLSLSGAKQGETLRRAMEACVDGVPVFDCVQVTWNLLEPSTSVLLAEAHEAGMGVIVKEALANGRLSPKNDNPEFSQQRALLEEVAAELKCSLDALALAAVLAQPWADIVLSGAANVEQLESNIRALDVPWNEDVAERLAGIRETAEVYWKTRSELQWV